MNLIKKIIGCRPCQSSLVDIEDLIADPTRTDHFSSALTPALSALPSALHPILSDILIRRQSHQGKSWSTGPAQETDQEVSLNSVEFYSLSKGLDVSWLRFRSPLILSQATRYGFGLIDAIFRVDNSPVKATFMGRSSFDGYIGPKPHNDQHLYLPLTTKCSYHCAFCNVPSGFPGKISELMMADMITAMLTMAYSEGMIEPGADLRDNLKIGFVKCGDPLNTENIKELLELTARRFPEETLRISTIFPKKKLRRLGAEEAIMSFVQSHPRISVRFQVSINGTSDAERRTWTRSGAPLAEISEFAHQWRTRFRTLRPDCKVILNFTIAKETECLPTPEFVRLFPADVVDIRIRPAEPVAGREFITLDDTDIKRIVGLFKEQGYKVILGVATEEEKKNSLISGQATGVQENYDSKTTNSTFSQAWHDEELARHPLDPPYYAL